MFWRDSNVILLWNLKLYITFHNICSNFDKTENSKNHERHMVRLDQKKIAHPKDLVLVQFRFQYEIQTPKTEKMRADLLAARIFCVCWYSQPEGAFFNIILETLRDWQRKLTYEIAVAERRKELCSNIETADAARKQPVNGLLELYHVLTDSETVLGLWNVSGFHQNIKQFAALLSLTVMLSSHSRKFRKLIAKWCSVPRKETDV